jgi:molecular chaperone HtpG
VAKGDLDLGAPEDEAEKQEQQKVADDYKGLVERVKGALGDKVQAVRMTLRLTDSPSCLVVDDHAMSGHLARLLKAAGQNAPASAPLLELNPHHPLVLRLREEAADSPRFSDWAHLLFEQALLAEGGQLEDPAAFVRRVNGLLLDAAR